MQTLARVLRRRANFAVLPAFAACLLAANTPPVATPPVAPTQPATPLVPAVTTPATPATTPPVSAPINARTVRKPMPPVEDIKPGEIVSVAAQSGLPTQELVFFGEVWKCELCLDFKSREVGMGARTEFACDGAMVFVHPQTEMLAFWMKDCRIDLDMVFVDAKGTICALAEAKRERLRYQNESRLVYERRLKRYSSNRPAKYVLEFPAGTLDRLKNSTGQPTMGQTINIDWASLDKRAH